MKWLPDLLLKTRLWFVGNPSTVDSISVASINNDVITTEVFEVKGLEGNAEADNGKFDYSKSAADADFEKAKSTNMCQLVLKRR